MEFPTGVSSITSSRRAKLLPTEFRLSGKGVVGV